MAQEEKMRPDFLALLWQLRDEHMREVSELHKRIRVLVAPPAPTPDQAPPRPRLLNNVKPLEEVPAIVKVRSNHGDHDQHHPGLKPEADREQRCSDWKPFTFEDRATSSEGDCELPCDLPLSTTPPPPWSTGTVKYIYRDSKESRESRDSHRDLVKAPVSPPTPDGTSSWTGASSSRFSEKTLFDRGRHHLKKLSTAANDFELGGGQKRSASFSSSTVGFLRDTSTASSESEPNRFNLHPGWLLVDCSDPAPARFQRKLTPISWDKDDLPMSKLGNLVILPTSTAHMFWTFMSVAVILYDLLTIPLAFLSTDSYGGTAIYVSVLTALYWTLDVVLSFFKAFYREGALIADVRMIAGAYLRSWFPLDVAMVALDWTTIIVEVIVVGDSYSEFSSAGKALRVLRLTRTMRLVRVSKSAHMLASAQVLLGSGLLRMQISIALISLTIMVLSHWLACIWYGIGTLGDPEDTWLQQVGATSDLMPLGERYVLCLHWALTQFGVGSSPIFPRNGLEFMYNSMVLILSLLISSTLVSLMTNAVAQLKDMQNEKMTQFAYLRRFCTDKCVPRELYSRIYKYAEHRYMRNDSALSMCDVKLIDILSQPLKEELHHHIWRPYLSRHPAFASMACPRFGVAFRCVCSSAVTTTSLAYMDKLSVPGTLASSMYFIISGELSYVGPNLRHMDTYEAPDWLLEMPLWTAWVTVGQLEAMAVTEVIVLNGNHFQQAMTKQPEAYMLTRSYAWRFVTYLNGLDDDGLSDTLRLPQDRLEENPDLLEQV